MYLNRRIPKSEIGKRVSTIDVEQIKQISKKWLETQTPSITNWGKEKLMNDNLL
jgi:hypothetical protein